MANLYKPALIMIGQAPGNEFSKMGYFVSYINHFQFKYARSIS